MVKLSRKIYIYSLVTLIAFCQLSSLIIEVFPPVSCAQTVTKFGSGHIEVQNIANRVAELLFVFDEETGSSDILERSTSWLVIRQFNVTTAIPIGRADPDWELVGTNNKTIWHWKLEKTYHLQYETNGDPFWVFPREVFSIQFYIATNCSRRFSIDSNVPGFSVWVEQQKVDYDQFYLDMEWAFQPEGCPDFLTADISVFHNPQYQFVVSLLYIVIAIIGLICGLLVIKRNDLEDSDFLRVSSSILLFAPVFFSHLEIL